MSKIKKPLFALGSVAATVILILGILNASPAQAATNVDDAGSGWTYSSGWSHCTNCNEGAVTFHNASQSWANVTASATYNFTGNRVSLYAVKAPHHGIGAVSIDGGAEILVDFYGTSKVGNTLIWSSPTLTQGNHSFRLRWTGTKNAASSNTVITLDRLEYDVAPPPTTTTTPPTTTQPPNPAGFVTRDSNTGNLMLNGQRFRYSGPNIYWLGLSESQSPFCNCGGIHLPPQSEINAALTDAQSMGAAVVRTFGALSVGHPLAIQPTHGVFNQNNFASLDWAIKAAKDRGLRLVLPLVDNYNYYHGGKNTYLNWRGLSTGNNGSQFFTNATVRNDFKAHITAVLNHVNPYTGLAYKNDPTIMAWETGNELAVYPATWTHSSWTGDIANHIKSVLGAQQLVMDGKYGIYSQGTTVDTASLNLPNVDIYSTHSYDNFRSPSGVVNEGTIAHNADKAFVLGEYTWTGSGGWTLTSMLSAIEASANVDGDNFWSLFANGVQHGDGYTLHWPGDNSNMVTRANQLKNHALNMNPVTPPPPTTTTTTTNPTTTTTTTPPTTTTTTTPPAPLPGRITRSGRQLMLNGHQYKFAGLNIDTWFGCWAGEREAANNDANLDRYFRELNPRSMSRIWVYTHSASDIALLQKIVAKAEQYQQYLMVTLSDSNAGGTQCGSLKGSGYPSNGGAVLAHAQALVPLFKDSPAVAVWELINEGSTSASTAGWYNTIGNYINGADPDSLIASGAFTCWNGTPISQCTAVNNPAWNDLVSLHEYDYSNGGVTHHAQNTEALAASLGLPWFSGESGFCCNGAPSGQSETFYANLLNQEYNSYLNAAGSAGMLYWDFKFGHANNFEVNAWDAMWNVAKNIRHQWQEP